MSIQRRGWMWLAGVAVLAVVAIFALRWALSSPNRREADRYRATATAAAEATDVARSVAATLTADAGSVGASSDTTERPEATDSAPDPTSEPPGATEAVDAVPTEAPAEPTATEAPTEAPPPTATEDPAIAAAAWIGRSQEGGSIGEAWRLIDTRLGRHEGFTRIVWEFQADVAAPRWRVVERDMADGAPATFPPGAISGTAWLEVRFTDVIAMEAPQALEPKESPGGAIVTGTALQRPPAGEEDDATMGFAVGLARPTRFQAVALDGPARLVLDVYDSP